MWNGNHEMKLTLNTTKILKYNVTNLSNKYHTNYKKIKLNFNF